MWRAFLCCLFYNPICSFMCAPNAIKWWHGKSVKYESNGPTIKLKHQRNLSKTIQTESHIKRNIIKTQTRILCAQTTIINNNPCDFEKYEIIRDSLSCMRGLLLLPRRTLLTSHRNRRGKSNVERMLLLDQLKAYYLHICLFSIFHSLSADCNSIQCVQCTMCVGQWTV